MGVAIDTGFFVAMMKGSKKAKNLWNRLRQEKARPVVSTLVIGELTYVLYRDGKGHREIEMIVDSLSRLSEITPVDIHTAKKAAELKHNHGMPYVDCLIFATALQTGCNLLYTSDRNHMNKMKGKGIEILFCRE